MLVDPERGLSAHVPVVWEGRDEGLDGPDPDAKAVGGGVARKALNVGDGAGPESVAGAGDIA